MTREYVKDRCNEMIEKIIDYIVATDIPVKEKQNISMEIGLALIMVTVDTNQPEEEVIREILTKMGLLTKMALTQSGENIIKEYGEK